MSKPFQVLIIEDDKTLGPALLSAFKKAGFDSYLAQGPEAAETLCSHCDFSVILADCMLPRMDGVSLLKSLLPQMSNPPVVFLMTGVFKDKTFLSEAKRKTGAREILSKPFELKEIIKKIKECQEKEENAPPPEKKLIEYFCELQPSVSDIIERFSEPNSIEGRELPFLISLLVHVQWSGALHIQPPSGSNGAIYLRNGEIAQVALDDSKSLLGHLLMVLGFVEPEELEAALQMNDKAMIGQRLINQLSISPHALDLALAEQNVLRLSQMISPEIVELKLVPNSKLPNIRSRGIGLKRLSQLYSEWGNSKYTLEFLAELLEDCMEQPLALSPDKSKTLKSYLVEHSLGDTIEKLLSREILPTYAKEQKVTSNSLRKKYENLESSLKQKNYFQMLGLSNKAVSKEIERAYLSLKSSMKSNLKNISDADLLETHKRISDRIHHAYETLIDDTSRQSYLHRLESERQQQLLAKEPEYELGIALLNDGRFKDAHYMFKQLADQNFRFPDLTSYLIVSEARSVGRPVTEADLNKVSPENRQSGPFLLAKAFHFKSHKKYSMALQFFRKALVYNPSSKLIQKEMASCLRRKEREHSKGKGSILESLVDGILGNQQRKKAS